PSPMRQPKRPTPRLGILPFLCGFLLYSLSLRLSPDDIYPDARVFSAAPGAELQTVAHEFLQFFCRRVLKDLAAALFPNLTLMHEHNAMSEPVGKGHFMRDQNHGHTFNCQRLNDFKH